MKAKEPLLGLCQSKPGLCGASNTEDYIVPDRPPDKRT